MGPDYWPLPPQQVGSHVLGGFASRDAGGTVRLALFNHHGGDIQSRSDQSFKVAMTVAGAAGDGAARVTEYRFDRDRNSYYRQALALSDEPAVANQQEVDALSRILEEGDAAKVREAFPRMKKLGVAGQIALAPALMRYATTTNDAEFLKLVESLAKQVFSSSRAAERGYPREAVKEIEKLAQLRPTALATVARQSDGSIRLTPTLAANGAAFLVIESAKPEKRE
jgi:hypothetical protein